MKNSKLEIPVYSFFLAFCAVFFYGTFKIKTGRAATVSDAFLPRIVVVLMMVLLVILLVQAILKRREENAAKKSAEEKAAEKVKTKQYVTKILFVTLVMGITVYMMDTLGFIIAMTFFLLCMFIGLAEKGKRRLKISLPIALIFPIVLFILYLEVFSVLLPAGILKFLT